jgi:hypothetical protein
MPDHEESEEDQEAACVESGTSQLGASSRNWGKVRDMKTAINFHPKNGLPKFKPELEPVDIFMHISG